MKFLFIPARMEQIACEERLARGTAEKKLLELELAVKSRLDQHDRETAAQQILGATLKAFASSLVSQAGSLRPCLQGS